MSTTGPIRALLAGFLALLVSVTSAAAQHTGLTGQSKADTPEAQGPILASMVAEGHGPAPAPAPENSDSAVLPATEADPKSRPSLSPSVHLDPALRPRVARMFPPARGPPAAET